MFEWSPDGRLIYFSALKNAIGDIWSLDVETRELKNLTQDEFADYAPTVSADGKFLVYIARISGNNKLFRLDLATGAKIWEFEAGASIVASPAVASGRIVIGSQDGVLYAFGH